MTKRFRSENSEILKDIKKKYKAGTLNYLVALVDSIDSLEVLRREKITLAEFRGLIEIKKDMVDLGGGVDVFQSAIKDFFERHGFDVSPKDADVSWYVSCKERAK